MAAITATNSATPSLQASLGRTRLEQARREADQAEAAAKDLRAQADDAERQAQDSQENVRKVATSNQRDETTYSAPRPNSTSEVPLKVQNLIVQIYSASRDERTKGGNPLKTNASAVPVVNTQGQSTGRILNLSA